jgi:hypothetical protein
MRAELAIDKIIFHFRYFLILIFLLDTCRSWFKISESRITSSKDTFTVDQESHLCLVVLENKWHLCVWKTLNDLQDSSKSKFVN